MSSPDGISVEAESLLLDVTSSGTSASINSLVMEKMILSIQAVITALGTVCFALSYIDSTKARRVNGILLEKIGSPKLIL